MSADLRDIVVRKPWGFEYMAFRNPELSIWALQIAAGQGTSLHCHARKNAAFVVLRGTVELQLIRGAPLRFTAVDKINVFRGRFHRLSAPLGDATLLEIEAPDDKDDLVRLEDTYGRGATYEGAEAHAPRDDRHIWLGGEERTVLFAGCTLRTFAPRVREELRGLGEREVVVTLHGGLERGLLPPGDAVDGVTLNKMVRAFAPVSGSSFLHIKEA